MIEQYIEKDILRQIKFVEYLLDNDKLRVSDLAKHFSVSNQTIFNDMENINVTLEGKMQLVNYHGYVSYFKLEKEKSNYDLLRRMYSESKFLRICARYSLNQTNYTELEYHEFLSVSTIFKLKKRVEKLLDEMSVIQDKETKTVHELNFRYFVLAVWMRCDLLDEYVDPNLWNQCQDLVDLFQKELANEFMEVDHDLLMKGIYLSIVRMAAGYKLHVESLFLTAKKHPYFQPVWELFQKAFPKKEIPIEEGVFLTLLLALMPLNTCKYQISQLFYTKEQEWIRTVLPEIEQLILLFEQKFKLPLKGKFEFEYAVSSFSLSLIWNAQSFLLKKHVYLTREQQLLKTRLRQVILEWQKHYYPQAFPLMERPLDLFCLQVCPTLMEKPKHKQLILVIAHDEATHILYRENLMRHIYEEEFEVDDTMYYTLESIPNYLRNSIILCDRNVVKDYVEIPKLKYVYFLSNNHVNQELKMITDQFKQQLSEKNSPIASTIEEHFAINSSQPNNYVRKK
ncbi:helix-turn-helix domain-containing protein [Enterococcus sp. DIV1283b]|uniref:helix-turn-helix domain-containing protein n=1 Tax=Enterococcus sp. DIV1283b TaxID=2774745 RepID=UPI003F244A2B